MTDRPARPQLPSETPRAHRWTLPGICLLALVLTAISRAPLAAVGGADDGFYAEVAHLWRNGFLPYEHAFDVKPPGIFAVLALVQSLVGETNLALRLIGWMSDAVTMTALMVFCQQRREFGAGVAAALLYSLLMPHILDDDAYDLLIAVTSVAVILAMTDRPPHRRAIEAGLMIGAAGFIKQTAAFEALAILVILMSETKTTSARLKTAALFIACALFVPLLCALYFALNGGLEALLRDTVLTALQRSSTISMRAGIGNFIIYCLDIAPLLAISIAMVVRQSHLPRFRRETRALGVWLVASTLAVLVQHAAFSRYIGPMLPPSLLLTALGTSIYLQSRQHELRLLLIVLAASLTALSLGLLVTTRPSDMSGIRRITKAIEAAHPAPEDRLYIAIASADAIWVYVTSGLRPPTAFLIPMQQLCPFPNAGPARIDESLAARPRFVIVDRDAAEKGYQCEVAGARDKITSALAQDYHLAVQTEGQSERFNLYERNDKAKP